MKRPTIDRGETMNSVSRSVLAVAALALLLAGCQERDVLSGTWKDPSVPDAATTFAAQDAAAKTRALEDTAAVQAQSKAAPQEKMTTAEESKAMPLPGQANDHSTTALDRKKGG
jgi:hypothetical protein